MKDSTTTSGPNVGLMATSNGFFSGGIRTGLELHPGVASFTNASLGASGAVAIPWHLEGLDLSALDLLLIDFSINESGAINQGHEVPRNSLTQLGNLVDRASRAGCVPVILNFPTIHNVERLNPVWEVVQRELRPRGVIGMDISGLLARAAGAAGIDPGRFFLDPMHLHRPISFRLGQIALEAALAARAAHGRPLARTDLELGTTGFLSAPFDGAETILRRTSRISARLQVLEAGDGIALPDGPARTLRGLLYNAANARGVLEFDDGSVLARFGTESGMEAVLKTGTGAGPELVLIAYASQVLDVPLPPGTRLTLRPGAGESTARLELGGLIHEVADARREMHVLGVDPAHAELGDAGGEALMAEMVAIAEEAERGAGYRRGGGTVLQSGPRAAPAPWHLRHGPHPVTPPPVPGPVTDPETGSVSGHFFCGGSLAAWWQGGGPEGQAWSAEMQFPGAGGDGRYLTFAEGMHRPGLAPRSRALVPAADAVLPAMPQYDAAGRPTGRMAHRASASPGLAFLFRRAGSGDARHFAANLAQPGRPLSAFLPAGDEGAEGGWIDQVYRPALRRFFEDAARAGGGHLASLSLETGEREAQSHTRAAYRAELDAVVQALQAEVPSDRPRPVVSAGQPGHVLNSAGAAVAGRLMRQVADTALAVLDKGLSEAPEDRDFLCTGPRYDLSFLGPHQPDHFGCLHGEERNALILSEDARLRATGGAWRPAHVTRARYIEDDAGYRVEVALHLPFAPVVIDTDILPEKPGHGFSLIGGRRPGIAGVRPGADGHGLILDLDGPWMSSKRSLGIAIQAEGLRQGWSTHDDTPAGDWRHLGPASNIRDSAPWRSMVTGMGLYNWLAHQIVEVDR